MNENKIIDMYENQNRSTYEIAKEFDTYPNKIRRILIKNGCEMKDKSQAQKNALKQGVAEHPTKGKRRSEETKMKISESQAKVWDNLSHEERVQRSLIGKEAWNKKTPEEKSIFLQKAGDAIRHAAKTGSKMEKFLLEALINEGFRVEFHKTHWLQNSELEIDLYVPDLKTVIEVDGPSHFKPVWGHENLARNQLSDMQKDGLVLRQGMVMIRVKQMKRLSQKYMRDTLDGLLNLLKQIENSYPSENERYFEL
jgi:very-short-patch-repair endonuclease